MLEKLNFMIYALYNSAYRDGNHIKSESPKWNVLMLILVFEFAFLCFLYMSYRFLYYLFYGLTIEQPRNGDTHFLALFLFILLLICNYLYFIKGGYFDKLYAQYANQDKKREKRYKIMGLIFFFIFCCSSIISLGFLKLWFYTG